MTYLQEKILTTLGAFYEPVSAGRLIQFVMISAPNYPFSWESFVDSLNSLVTDQRVIESQTGYRLRDEHDGESNDLLKEIGL
jgi:hypothetical protein